MRVTEAQIENAMVAIARQVRALRGGLKPARLPWFAVGKPWARKAPEDCGCGDPRTLFKKAWSLIRVAPSYASQFADVQGCSRVGRYFRIASGCYYNRFPPVCLDRYSVDWQVTAKGGGWIYRRQDSAGATIWVRERLR